MLTQTKIFSIGDFDCRGFSATIARFLGGNLGASVFLQQLYYWSDRAGGLVMEGKKFIYKTLAQWGHELGGLSPNQVRRFVKPLIDLGLIEVQKLNKKRWDQTNYYSLNVERLQELFLPPETKRTTGGLPSSGSPASSKEEVDQAETIENSEYSCSSDRVVESVPSEIDFKTVGDSDSSHLLYTKNLSKNLSKNISTEADAMVEFDSTISVVRAAKGKKPDLASSISDSAQFPNPSVATNTKLVEKIEGVEKIDRAVCSMPEAKQSTAFWQKGNVQERLNRNRLLPVGEWTINGKLDGKFHDWMAAKWLESYGDRYKGDRFAARADILAHFINQPEKLPIRWQQYSEEYSYRYQQTSSLLAAGIKVEEDYQQRLVENVRAVANPLSLEDNPVAQINEGSMAPFLSGFAAESIASTGNSCNTNWKQNIPGGFEVENVEAYKIFVPPCDRPNPEEIKLWWEEAKAKVAAQMAMPKAKKESSSLNKQELLPEPVALNSFVDFRGLTIEETNRKVDLLNDWLSVPALANEAVRLAKQTNELTIIYHNEQPLKIELKKNGRN